MSGERGVVYEDMVDLKREFSHWSAEVIALISALNTKQEATWWRGRSADSFRAAWDGEYVPNLNRIAEALEGASADVGTTAENFRAADEAGAR